MPLPDFSDQCVGRYRLTSVLSFGATSSVYGAVDKELSRRYAIKCISKSELSPKQLLLRTSEVFHHQLVSGCPHVLPLQEIIDQDSYLFIVFNQCESDLFQAIWGTRIYLRNNPLIKETFLDILDGVYACHARGVFHRDLKPENILCEESGSDIRIADFGLATRKRICRGSRCGTPDYMSPEQWTKNVVYYPSLADVWSLGIILLNMVTGRRPWKTARVTDDQFRAFLDDKDYLYKTFPISRELNALLKRILCPNPMGRPQILQIREAILNIDSFFRIPFIPNDTALREPRQASLERVKQLHDVVPDLEKPLAEKRSSMKRTDFRSLPPYPGRDLSFIHELLDAEDMAGMKQNGLPLPVYSFA